MILYRFQQFLNHMDKHLELPQNIPSYNPKQLNFSTQKPSRDAENIIQSPKGKVNMPENTDQQSKKQNDLTSSQIMTNLNSSLQGLFSRIRQIKEENNPLEQIQNQDNFAKFPILNLKQPKKFKKSLSLKAIEDKIQDEQQNQGKNNQLLTKSTKIFTQKKGLLDLPAMKMSMEITDQVFNTNQCQSANNSASPFRKQKQQIRQEINEKAINLKLADFELGVCVGSGKFGDVFVCRHKQTNSLYGLKKIFKSTLKEYQMINQFILELRIHYMLDHPNIIKLYGHFDDEYHIFLLMEYAEGGILLKKLKSTQEYTSQIIQQSLFAVDYLHKKQIAHRDIKPQNIVLQFGSVIKLCDFGWSSFCSNQMKTTFCGTLDYLSPQMKDRGEYGTSVDLWSIGVLTFQILAGQPPHQKEITKWRMKGGKREDKWNWKIRYPPSFSKTTENFISNLLKERPEERANIKECLSHNFIKKHRYFLEQLDYFFEFKSII